MTCWRRLAEWNVSGIWQRLHEVMPDRLRPADTLNLFRAAVDSSQIRAPARPRSIADGSAASTT